MSYLDQLIALSFLLISLTAIATSSAKNFHSLVSSQKNLKQAQAMFLQSMDELRSTTCNRRAIANEVILITCPLPSGAGPGSIATSYLGLKLHE